MKNGVIKIQYIDASGKLNYGYTTEAELKEQGVKTYLWVTDDINDIRNGDIVAGWTIDYLDIVEIFELEENI